MGLLSLFSTKEKREKKLEDERNKAFVDIVETFASKNLNIHWYIEPIDMVERASDLYGYSESQKENIYTKISIAEEVNNMLQELRKEYESKYQEGLDKIIEKHKNEKG